MLQRAANVKGSAGDGEFPRYVFPLGSHMPYELLLIQETREYRVSGMYLREFGRRSKTKEAEILISYAGRNFEASPKVLIEIGEQQPMSLISRHFPDAMSGKQFKLFAVTTRLLVNQPCMLGLAPIARAILLQSVQDLDRVLALEPEAAMERIEGITTLELCVAWPEGLRRLLRTRARELIDVGAETKRLPTLRNATPIRRALVMRYAESVEVLMKSGCALDLVPELYHLFWNTPPYCLRVIASNLAERRRDLLRLCQEELGIYLDWHPINVPDGEAHDLCATLAKFDISIPRHLLVPPDYGTIFHFPGLNYRAFEIFWDQGFRGSPSHNPMGLTPIMVWRPHHDATDMWKWAQNGRLGDQTQEDPLSLGLNTSSTGWHYIAATVGFTPRAWDYHASDFYRMMMEDLSQSTIRDQCVCWCSPNGDGCSATKSLWTACADWRRWERGRPVFDNDYDEAWRHSVLHHDPLSEGSSATPTITTALGFVRLVTFEALDMTHTCCYLEQVESLRGKRPISPAQRKALSAESNWNRDSSPHVIANCNPQLAEEIRSDILEQQNARQLDELMGEFEPEILNLDFADPKARTSNPSCLRRLFSAVLRAIFLPRQRLCSPRPLSSSSTFNMPKKHVTIG